MLSDHRVCVCDMVQEFVNDFADRTRQIKSMVLLHSAKPDDQMHKVVHIIAASALAFILCMFLSLVMRVFTGMHMCVYVGMCIRLFISVCNYIHVL